jgi:hypothetical protein
MLHSFFYPETVKAFTGIAIAEPSCAMAYWGIAISQRPNPLVGPFPPAVPKNGWEAIEKAQRATPREGDWIESLAAFFKDYTTVDQHTPSLAYEAAMGHSSAPAIPTTLRLQFSMHSPSTRPSISCCSARNVTSSLVASVPKSTSNAPRIVSGSVKCRPKVGWANLPIMVTGAIW